MSSPQFLRDRERGKVGQHLLAETIRKMGVGVKEVEDGFFQDYDLLLDTGTTIEVKTDYMAQSTGNICLEISALDHSLADVLAIAYGSPIQAYYMLPLDKARKFALDWPLKKYVGEFGLEAAIVSRSLFCELLKPEVLVIQQN